MFVFATFWFAAEIANYKSDDANEAWMIFGSIQRVDFLLVIFALRIEVKRLISTIGYRVILYLLINHFIDRYLGYNTWSINDIFTIAGVLLEFFIYLYKKRK